MSALGIREAKDLVEAQWNRYNPPSKLLMIKLLRETYQRGYDAGKNSNDPTQFDRVEAKLDQLIDALLKAQ